MKSVWAFACCALVAAALPQLSHADAKQQRQAGKRIAVAAFDAPDHARARMAILEVLSEHDEVEVVALEDIQVAAKRLKVDATQPAGRQKLSDELGIEAWLDGTIEDGSARFSLHAPDGRTIASTSVTGHKANVAAGLAGPKVWAAMGPWLSPRERGKRALEAQVELALKKAKAREQELVRLRQVMEKRALDRVAQLKAAQSLAREKRKAFEAEMERQATVVSERLAAAEKQRKVDERRRAQAEEAEFMASLQQSAPPPEEEPSPAPRAGSAWGASSSVWATPATATASAAPTGFSSGSRSPSAAPAEPAAASTGLSPATQRWLMAQGGMPAASAASAPRYSHNAPVAPAAPAAAAPMNQDGLSPATRRWLEQQQLH